MKYDQCNWIYFQEIQKLVDAFLVFFYAARILLDISSLIFLHIIVYNPIVRLSSVSVLDPLSPDTPVMGNVLRNSSILESFGLTNS